MKVILKEDVKATWEKRGCKRQRRIRKKLYPEDRKRCRS